jgi:uncharacterized membrane protein
VDPYLNDWLDFLLRWLHVVAGIVWIGTSFYFVALDNHLNPPTDRRDVKEGVGGDSWEIHGGGFYRIQKFRIAPRRLPEPLHWFKWEAYTTWLSGFALLIVLYYANADTYLIDRSVADLEEWEAIAISIGLLAAAWLVYDVLCRVFARNALVLAAAIAGLVTLSAWGLGNLFGPRAAFIQLGAMLGTIMVANVFFVIIPGQREVVRAKQEGREPDAAPGIRGKQRSVHNNYLTLPVVFAMLSPHFPIAIGHEHAWAVVVALMAVGAWIRHYFNLRHRGLNVWPIPLSAGIALVAIALAIKPEDEQAVGAATRPVDFARVQAIVAERCAPCHSANPTRPGFTAAPAGVELDTAEQIRAQAEAIERQAVDSRAMPLGNVTGMTDEERAELAAWLAGR